LSNSPRRRRNKKTAAKIRWKRSISFVSSVGRNWPTVRLAVGNAEKPGREVIRSVWSSSMKNLALGADVAARLPKATLHSLPRPSSLTTNPAKEIAVSPASATLISATFDTTDPVYERIHTPLILTTTPCFRMPLCMHHLHH
jgi:hypothetical protein